MYVEYVYIFVYLLWLRFISCVLSIMCGLIYLVKFYLTSRVSSYYLTKKSFSFSFISITEDYKFSGGKIKLTVYTISFFRLVEY